MITTHDDGGPAYPVAYEHSEATCEQHGMSLRDYFAATALPGFLHMVATGQHCVYSGDMSREECIARDCYRLADAMLKARGAKP